MVSYFTLHPESQNCLTDNMRDESARSSTILSICACILSCCMSRRQVCVDAIVHLLGRVMCMFVVYESLDIWNKKVSSYSWVKDTIINWGLKLLIQYSVSNVSCAVGVSHYFVIIINIIIICIDELVDLVTVTILWMGVSTGWMAHIILRFLKADGKWKFGVPKHFHMEEVSLAKIGLISKCHWYEIICHTVH